MASKEEQAIREGVEDKERVEQNLNAHLDVLECTIGCKSDRDVVVEDDTLAGVKLKTMVVGEYISVECCLLHLIFCEG